MKAIKILPNAVMEEIEIEDDFRAIQKELECNVFTTAFICKDFEDDMITVYADDEGIINHKKVSVITVRNESVDGGVFVRQSFQCLYGNLLLVGNDELGNDRSLTPGQFRLIKDRLDDTTCYISYDSAPDETCKVFCCELEVSEYGTN